VREARAGYARWRADGKVRQLDSRYPHLQEAPGPAPTGAFTARLEHLDVLSVVKASQTISGEMVLEKLVRTLLETVLEHSGAQQAYLIFARDSEPTIEARATLVDQGVETTILPSEPVDASTLVPVSIVQYVRRAKERVLLEDAGASRYANDPYIARRRTRSVLCLPVVRHGGVAALLYLENNLATGAFTAERIAVLELLTAQVAISLDNATLLAAEHAARDEREHLYREAVAANRARDEFLTIAAHELRGPLSALTMNLETLLRSEDVAKKQEKGEKARQQAAHLAQLIGELLEVSRITAGELHLDVVALDLVDVVRKVLDRVVAPGEARAQIAVRDDGPVPGRWDPGRIEQAVANLVSNAVKFGEGRPVEVTVLRAGGRAQLVVQDHGVGLGSDDLSRLFQRFTRLGAVERYGGLGMGLYIACQIVRAHGGTIRAESRLGEGSTFTVDLPIEPASAGPASPAS
jgi:signal transduction histidine kinase